MPVTPFHFGLGAVLHATAPRQISFLSFCAANVLIDLESLHNLVNDRFPVHAFFHTYVGASFVVIAVPVLFLAVRWLERQVRLPNFLDWRELSLRQVAMGAVLGGYSHIVLDSVMHDDIQPLAPFTSVNVLLRILSLDALHALCVVLGIVGVAILGVRLMLNPR